MTGYIHGYTTPEQERLLAQVESALPALVELPGAPPEAELRRGLADLRALPGRSVAGFGWVMHKSAARTD